MITKLLPFCLLAFLVPCAAQTEASSAQFDFQLREREGVLELKYQGRPVLVYAFHTNQFKPYVRELYTLRGDNILLDAPSDHLHHHGLMFAVRVNGANFWEENNQPGFQKPIGPVSTRIERLPNGGAKASFSHKLHWISWTNRTDSPTDAIALLIERRTVTVAIDEEQKETSLAWRAEFEVGPAAAQVVLTGTAYHGLGLRLAESFNGVATHFNSANAPYPTGGTGDVISAQWSAIGHRIEARDITVAFFGKPLASGAQPSFFTMVRPFTYLSITQGLDRAPLEFSSGSKFHLEYLLALYPQRKSPEYLQRRFEAWQR